MEQVLLTLREVDEFPAVAVHRLGRVFAGFGRPAQDSGNVSYGIDAGGKRFFVKTAGDPQDTVSRLPLAARIALLRNAVEVNRNVSHATLPELVHVIESPAGPMLVFAWRDGEVGGGFARAEPGSTFRRFLALPVDELLDVLDAIFDLFVTLAAAGWIVEDFFDGNLLYDFASRAVTVADLDTSHGPVRLGRGVPRCLVRGPFCACVAPGISSTTARTRGTHSPDRRLGARGCADRRIRRRIELCRSGSPVEDLLARTPLPGGVLRNVIAGARPAVGGGCERDDEA